jgi:RNA polymerase sigma factor (TIGR02999 family)
MAEPESVTVLLTAWSQGDREALEKLTPLVYDELHRLAAHYLRNQPPGHTLQTTALVHEAYLELLGLQPVQWKDRAHFIGLAARMMRCVLVDYARKRSAGKRGGGAIKVSLSRAERVMGETTVDVTALDDALEEFARQYPRPAKVVELYFFGGSKIEEIPAVLGAGGLEVSLRTVERDLKFARAWLLQEIQGKSWK